MTWPLALLAGGSGSPLEPSLPVDTLILDSEEEEEVVGRGLQ